MEDLYKTLQTIRQHPTVRLGKHSIFHLEAFFFGYYYMMRHLEMPYYMEHYKGFDNLIGWIRKKYVAGKNRSWASVILFYSEDERDALDKFF
ncbi:hypothetical protein AB0758_45125 [Tolypothrix bouteillei VB521301_2]|uniref:hypothetical protein n=1 Tax=Tolypothrix bouteillei TaxID=1246981 RepID=UPI0038B4ABCC